MLSIGAPGDALDCPPRTLPVLQPAGLPSDLLDAPLGRPDARAGAAAATAIREAVRLALDGQVSAIVTAPIHKEALAAAGIGFPGHTEMLQALAGAGDVRMMLANGELRVVLVTIHMALRKAVDAVTFEAVFDTLRIAHRHAMPHGAAPPRIAVAGSIRMPARAGCSATRRCASSRRPSPRRAPKASTPGGRMRPTRCSCAPAMRRRHMRASSTSSSP